MKATRRDLELQLNRVITNGWLPWFQREAARAGTSTAHILSIGSRETNLANIRGDFRNGKYNGYGVMQVDIGTDPEYARTWTKENVQPSIVRGVDIFLMKVRDTQRCVGAPASVRGRSFKGRAVEADDLRRIATAAYNCGRWAHYHFSRGANVDSTTTGHDYSRDVYDRAIEFAEMLEDRQLEQNAVRAELDLQGKYARRVHLDRFGYEIQPTRVTLPHEDPQEDQDELKAVDFEREVDPTDLSDDDIDLLGLGISSTAPSDSAGSTSLSDPTNTAVEAGAGITSLPPEGGSSPAPVETTFTEKFESQDGTRKSEASVTTSPGDAPGVNPISFLHLEDWKPFVARWLKRIWLAVTTITLPGGFGLGFKALQDPPNWFIYVAIAVVLIVVVLGLAFIVSMVLLAIWYFNRKEIRVGKELAASSLIDPNLKNLGLKIDPK